MYPICGLTAIDSYRNVNCLCSLKRKPDVLTLTEDEICMADLELQTTSYTFSHMNREKIQVITTEYTWCCSNLETGICGALTILL